MDLNKLFKETNKIISLKRLLPLFVLIGFVGSIMVLSPILKSKIPNKDFYKVELIGQVNDIKKKTKSTYFQIANNWYLIKDECIVHVFIGDSINKKKDSYMLKIYDKQSGINPT